VGIRLGRNHESVNIVGVGIHDGMSIDAVQLGGRETTLKKKKRAHLSMS